MRTKAIVIKKQNTNEYDQLVTCYTEELGKVVAIAKSILKKTSLQSMHLDVLNLVEFDLIEGRAWPIIASAQSEDTYIPIKNSIKKFNVAGFFLDIVDKIIFENERDSDMWLFLISNFKELKEAKEEDILNIFRKRQAEFLNISGYTPKIDNCSVCLTKENLDCEIDHEWALNFDMGGLICRNCYLQTNRGILLTSSDLKILRQASLADNYIAKTSLDMIFENITGRRLNSLGFIYR
ncbi:MAG: repair protein RecO protein [Candidatus Yanofskybacteria bacterium GW2011_GWD2_39_48]|uniref:DNA repair protein RecO n=1 Tax=Candidatus Yanofskybacteria bacterium GW2011_GWD2_39_48 TaxID=1619031 RepID=A0A0G0SC89_9BACT|nr:MAG: repair protein RecO protein [Candidatus Yanofskybacteria bacterium GW2011_GWD2_39_48]